MKLQSWSALVLLELASRTSLGIVKNASSRTLSQKGMVRDWLKENPFFPLIRNWMKSWQSVKEDILTKSRMFPSCVMSVLFADFRGPGSVRPACTLIISNLSFKADCLSSLGISEWPQHNFGPSECGYQRWYGWLSGWIINLVPNPYHCINKFITWQV